MKDCFTIQILTTLQSKQAVRPLYEEVFCEDSRPFVDYYFSDKCRDNVIIAMRAPDGRIVSMAHLNPYQMMFCGQIIPVYYIFAVATAPDCRHRGYMTKILDAGFEWMRSRHIPFAYLLPVDEAIYLPYGFRTVCGFSRRRIPYDRVRREYDIYCIQDEEYRRREKEEDRLSEGDDGSDLPDHPVIMACPADRDRLSQLLYLPQNTADHVLLEAMKEKKIYICSET